MLPALGSWASRVGVSSTGHRSPFMRATIAKLCSAKLNDAKQERIERLVPSSVPDGMQTAGIDMREHRKIQNLSASAHELYKEVVTPQIRNSDLFTTSAFHGMRSE